MGRFRSVCVLLAVVAAGVAVAACAQAQPKLRILDKERVWDLTNEQPKGVQVGETVGHEFVLKNEGTEPLEITEASAPDSFLTVELPTEPIPPDGEGRLKAAFCTEGMEPSRIESYITVKAKGVETPAVLTVRAQVIPRPETLLVVSQQERNVGLVRPGRATPLHYQCNNAGSTDLRLKPVKNPYMDDRFTVIKDIEPLELKAGETREFDLSFTPQASDAGRELDAFFTVHTGSEEQPYIVCRIRGYVEKPEGVKIVPRFIKSENTEPRYVFRIANNTAHAVEVVALRAGEEFQRRIVGAGEETGFGASVGSEEDLKQISFQVNPYYVRPKPPLPTSEGPEGGVDETPPADGGAVEPGAEVTTPDEPAVEEPEAEQPADAGRETPSAAE